MSETDGVVTSAPDDERREVTKPPPWLLAFSALCALVVVTFLAAESVGVDLRGGSPVILRRGAEAAVAVCVLVWALRPLPLARLAEAAGRPLLALLVAVLALTAVLQMAPVPRPWYPFSAWTMYAASPHAASYVTLETVGPSGEVERVRLASVLPVVTPRPFAATLVILARAHEEELEGVEEVLADLGRLLATRAGASETDRFRFNLCVVDEPTPEEPSTCRLVLEGAVGPQELG